MLNVYSKSTIRRMKKEKQEQRKGKMMIDKMIDAQENIIRKVFLNKNDDSVQIPVAFQSIIQNIQYQLGLQSNSLVDITPLEAFELIDVYRKKLDSIHYAKPTELFDILYYFALTPKELIVNKRFHRKDSSYC